MQAGRLRYGGEEKTPACAGVRIVGGGGGIDAALLLLPTVGKPVTRGARRSNPGVLIPTPNPQEAVSRSRNLAVHLGFAPRDSAVVVERCLGNRLFPECGRGTVCRDSPAQERFRSIFMAGPSTVPGRGRGPCGQRDVPAFGTPGIAAHGAPPTFKNPPRRVVWPDTDLESRQNRLRWDGSRS